MALLRILNGITDIKVTTISAYILTDVYHWPYRVEIAWTGAREGVHGVEGVEEELDVVGEGWFGLEEGRWDFSSFDKDVEWSGVELAGDGSGKGCEGYLDEQHHCLHCFWGGVAC